jgi:hypothetical protein
MLYAYNRKLLEEVTSQCSGAVNASVLMRATFNVIYVAKVRILPRRDWFFLSEGGARDIRKTK